MIDEFVVAVGSAAIRCGTPMAYAAVGETITERAGIINLGLEGMMLVGAMTAVAVQVNTGSALLAVAAAGLAAASLAGLHAYLTVGLDANQIVSGIAISILGTGLSGFLGRPLVGVPVAGIGTWNVPGLAQIPFIGPIFFAHDPLVYLAVAITLAVWFILYRTRFGLQIRAVGEDPVSAYAQTVPVRRTRVLAILLGGFLAGIGGAHLSLAFTHLWADKMTAGQGWIAVGLVVMAGWRPVWVLLAAYAFGAMTALHPHLQAAGVSISPYLVAMLPYLFAIGSLTIATLRFQRMGQGLPAALAKEFKP